MAVQPDDGRGFEELMSELDSAIGLLADGTAPLDDLVNAHRRALVVLGAARARLAELELRGAEVERLFG